MKKKSQKNFYAFPLTAETFEFTGASSFNKLLQDLEGNICEKMSNVLGVPASTSVRRGKSYSLEDQSIIIAHSISNRLRNIVKGQEFDKSIGVDLINLVYSVQDLWSLGRLSMYEGLLSVASQREQRTFEFVYSILSATTRWRLELIRHFGWRTRLQEFYALSSQKKTIGRKYLKEMMPSSLNKGEIIKEVFKKPKPSKRRTYFESIVRT